MVFIHSVVQIRSNGPVPFGMYLSVVCDVSGCDVVIGHDLWYIPEVDAVEVETVAVSWLDSMIEPPELTQSKKSSLQKNEKMNSREQNNDDVT